MAGGVYVHPQDMVTLEDPLKNGYKNFLEAKFCHRKDEIRKVWYTVALGDCVLFSLIVNLFVVTKFPCVDRFT